LHIHCFHWGVLLFLLIASQGPFRGFTLTHKYKGILGVSFSNQNWSMTLPFDLIKT
jgi:hypothetical protein